MRRGMFAVALACAAAVVVVVSLSAQPKRAVNTGDRGQLAVKGYDVVAYVTDSKPVVGRAEFEYRWNGAIWRFMSAFNRDAFSRDPEMYAPQFGGYCAWAVSRGYTADIDPEAWRIVDGQLYLNYSKRVQCMWEKDVRGNILKGQANWPSVLTR
jgi:hypothetical protein